MNVNFTKEQFDLVKQLLNKHYNEIADSWVPVDPEPRKIAYGVIISMRIPTAEKAWEEYCERYPHAEWRAYSDKEEFFKDQFTIYPHDLVTV